VSRSTGEILLPEHTEADGDCPACADNARRREATAVAKAKRAATTLRRYAKANRIGLLWTLTYAGDGCHDLSEAGRHIRRFQQQITEVLWPQYGRFPYLIVAEWHPGGHGIHWHVGVPRFISYQHINAIWPHGNTGSPRLSNERGSRPTVKDCARYLAKYVAKTYADQPVVQPGQHRYRRAQGFDHPPVRAAAVSRVGPEAFQQAMQTAIALVGRSPERVWSSDTVPDWTGPPTWLLYFPLD
jgi:hypothetical protein